MNSLTRFLRALTLGLAVVTMASVVWLAPQISLDQLILFTCVFLVMQMLWNCGVISAANFRFEIYQVFFWLNIALWLGFLVLATTGLLKVIWLAWAQMILDFLALIVYLILDWAMMWRLEKDIQRTQALALAESKRIVSACKRRTQN